MTNSETLTNIFLVPHLAGLVLAVGAMSTNVFTYRNLWKLYDDAPANGLAALKTYFKVETIGFSGIITLMLTGITMLWISNWTLFRESWFDIKLSVIVLLFLNRATLGRNANRKMEDFFKRKDAASTRQPDTLVLRKNMRTYQSMQLVLFFTIIVLSVFRFK